jgi:hypothetical protein
VVPGAMLPPLPTPSLDMPAGAPPADRGAANLTEAAVTVDQRLGPRPAPSSAASGSGAASSPHANEQSPERSPSPPRASVIQPGAIAPPNNESVREAETSFLPLQVTGHNAQVDQELLVVWKDYIKDGFKQNNTMFRRVLNAFMVPYWLTVVMYGLLFAFGLGGFAMAAVLFVQQQLEFAAIFGGLSVVSFLTFFISGPIRSLEQNLVFITWLGIIYNTYWSQLMNATDPKTVRQDLEAITTTALKDLNNLAGKHDERAAQRPGLSGSTGNPDSKLEKQP